MLLDRFRIDNCINFTIYRYKISSRSLGHYKHFFAITHTHAVNLILIHWHGDIVFVQRWMGASATGLKYFPSGFHMT